MQQFNMLQKLQHEITSAYCRESMQNMFSMLKMAYDLLPDLSWNVSITLRKSSMKGKRKAGVVSSGKSIGFIFL